MATLEAVFASRDHSNNNFCENESFDFMQQNQGDPSSPDDQPETADPH
jgi:hypothetical protein